MPEQPEQPHERFVREAIEIDLAYREGHLDEWLQEKLDEQTAAGINGRSSAVA